MNSKFASRAKKITLISAGILLLIVSTFIYNRSWNRALFINPVYKLPVDSKRVALTFDDGPSDVRTPLLLQVLDSLNVKATFFMLGKNIEKHRNIAKTVFEKGHLIGNHSYNHPRLIFKTPAFVKSQIQLTDSLIQDLGQKEVKYFRPPFSNKYIVLPLVLKSMNKYLVTGTYDPPSEYKTPYPAQKVADEVIKNIKPGAVIYLHDGKNTDADSFTKSVAIIITQLREQGYDFCRLDGKN